MLQTLSYLRLSLLFLFIALSTSTIAQELENQSTYQEYLDSLLNVINKEKGDTARVDKAMNICWSMMRNNPSMSLALLDKMEEINSEIEFDYKKAVMTYYRGIAHKNLGNTLESENYIKRFIDQMNAKGDTRRAMAGMQALGNLYTNLNLYDKAIELYTDVLSKEDPKRDSVAQARILTRLGFFLSKVDKFEEALGYNQKALDYLTNHKTTKTYINTLNDRGIIFEYMEQWDSMFHYYTLNLKLSENNGDLSNLVYAHYNLATGYQKNDEPDQAQYHFDACRKYALESANKIMLMHSYLGLAGIASKENQHRQGLKWLAKMDEEDLRDDLLYDQEKLRSQLYQKLGNYKMAYESLERCKMAGDSLSEQTSKSEIVAIENKYDRKQKELAILTLTSEKQSAELATEKANRRSIFLFSGLLISILLIGGILYFYYLKKKNNERLSEKNKIISAALDEKEILLKEIHHRVKNNLQMVSSLLSLQSMSQENESASQALEEGQLRVQSMALIHQHLYSGENVTTVNMKEYLEHLCYDIFSSHNIQDSNVNLELNISNIDLDIGTVMPLGLIFNELITNSCKYAFPNQKEGRITVTLKEEKGTLIAEVADNGVGDQSEREGFGSRLIHIFSKKMEAKRVRQSDNGVSDTFYIKNYKRA
ncbi:MAG: sensor histidine kinase [Bacteroidota bacterium]